MQTGHGGMAEMANALRNLPHNCPVPPTCPHDLLKPHLTVSTVNNLGEASIMDNWLIEHIVL